MNSLKSRNRYRRNSPISPSSCCPVCLLVPAFVAAMLEPGGELAWAGLPTEHGRRERWKEAIRILDDIFSY